MGVKVFRNYYEGLMEKTKGEGGSRGGRCVWLGSEAVVRENAENYREPIHLSWQM